MASADVETVRAAWRTVLLQLIQLPNVTVMLQGTKITGVVQGVEFPGATITVELGNGKYGFTADPTSEGSVKLKRQHHSVKLPRTVKFANVLGQVLSQAAAADLEEGKSAQHRAELQERQEAAERAYARVLDPLIELGRPLIPSGQLNDYHKFTIRKGDKADTPYGQPPYGTFELRFHTERGLVQFEATWDLTARVIERDASFVVNNPTREFFETVFRALKVAQQKHAQQVEATASRVAADADMEALKRAVRG